MKSVLKNGYVFVGTRTFVLCVALTASHTHIVKHCHLDNDNVDGGFAMFGDEIFTAPVFGVSLSLAGFGLDIFGGCCAS